MKTNSKKFLTGMITFLLGSLALVSFSQGVYVPSADKVINTGTVYIKGPFKTSGQVQNKGTLAVSQDFTVTPGTGVYTSTGIEKFVGTTTQHVTDPVVGTNYFNQLENANTGNVVLDANVDCETVVFSTNSLIDLSASNAQLKVKSTSPTAITGAGSAAYVKLGSAPGTGSLSRHIGVLNSPYAFTIGNTVVGYRRFDITLASLGVTGSDYITATLTNGSPGTVNFHKLYSTGFAGNYPGTPCTVGTNAQWVEFTCMTDHYWNITGPSDYQHTVTAYAGVCDGAGAGPRRVLQSPSGAGTWTSGVETVVGSVTQNLCENTDWTAASSTIPGGTYQDFGDFAIAAGFGAPLPVEMLSITATGIDNTFIRLNWQTASEQNSRGFQIQRTVDGVVWQDIGSVDGAGNSNQIRSYSIDDKTVSKNVVYYYRVIQVDYDGKTKKSSIVSAKLYGDPEVGDIFPNPSPGVRYVPIGLPTDQLIMLDVYDALGRHMYQQKVPGTTGIQNVRIDGITATGYYLVRIQIGEQVFTRRFVTTK